MKVVFILAPEGGEALRKFLEARLGDNWRVVLEGLEPVRSERDLAVMFLKVRGDEIQAGAVPGGGASADVVLVELDSKEAGRRELSLESELKSSTGATKVLLFCDESGRSRAFQKVLDLAVAKDEGGRMPEDIPQEVLDAVKKEAPEGRMPCERAQALAGELGVPIPQVGRALDLLGVKIIECQLGCF